MALYLHILSFFILSLFKGVGIAPICPALSSLVDSKYIMLELFFTGLGLTPGKIVICCGKTSQAQEKNVSS